MSADQERGIVSLPTSAPTSGMYSGYRPGDNLYGNSIVAVDAATGERLWHFQTVRHDLFDYDNNVAPILADITVDGEQIPALIQLTKQAIAYVLNRVTGEPVWPMVELAVPGSTTPGEYTAPTQPFPTKPAPFDRQGFTIDDLIDFTPELRAEAIEIIRPYRPGLLFTPLSFIGNEPGHEGHAAATRDGRRRAVGRRGLRSTDRNVVRAVGHRRGCDGPDAGLPRGDECDVHTRRAHSVTGPARSSFDQTPLRSDHRNRSPHGRSRLDGAEWERLARSPRNQAPGSPPPWARLAAP